MTSDTHSASYERTVRRPMALSRATENWLSDGRARASREIKKREGEKKGSAGGERMVGIKKKTIGSIAIRICKKRGVAAGEADAREHLPRPARS